MRLSPFDRRLMEHKLRDILTWTVESAIFDLDGGIEYDDDTALNRIMAVIDEAFGD